jgi:hypothetical protein
LAARRRGRFDDRHRHQCRGDAHKSVDDLSATTSNWPSPNLRSRYDRLIQYGLYDQTWFDALPFDHCGREVKNRIMSRLTWGRLTVFRPNLEISHATPVRSLRDGLSKRQPRFMFGLPNALRDHPQTPPDGVPSGVKLWRQLRIA